ncbi:MAG: copper resistance system multicopper oxidase [Spongiibacteraceae bacterium]
MNAFISRRRFVQGLGIGGVTLASGLPATKVHARVLDSQYTLHGRDHALRIDTLPVNFTGRTRPAVAVNGSLPAPILRWREGDSVRIDVTNRLDTLTAIHWHGIVLPYQMDGVPGISFPGIHPGETFRYEFELRQSGTYWYHGHAGFQEQLGLYGAIIIEPRASNDSLCESRCERDYVVMLSDWSDDTPEHVLSRLKKDPAYYNYHQRTVADSWDDIREKGLVNAWRERSMWNAMRMSDRDLADVTGATYSFLMNGHTPNSNWTGLFKAGERVRLRFINAAAMTFFDVRIPNLSMRVIAADGNPIEPVSVDEFRIGNAETVDVIVEPKADMAYTIFAQALDRSGFARGTLTSDPALIAEIPALDAAPILSHKEMGMGDAHAAHTSHNTSAMANYAGVDHSAHQAQNPTRHEIDKLGTAIAKNNPGVDMRADNPQPRLDDPGIGLGNNNRRVLTYADLAHRDMTPDMREPEREIELHITGNMERYMWSFDGVSYADAEPLHFRLGERLRITLINDTMMFHPVHLHGMWSDLETGNEHHLPRKHTLAVKPGEKLSYRVTVDAPGAWAYHCHLMYHMELGMFRKVVVA